MGFFDKLFSRPTLDHFAAELIQAMQEAGDTDELRHDSPERCILPISVGEVAGTINLGNLYGNDRRLPPCPAAGVSAGLRADGTGAAPGTARRV